MARKKKKKVDMEQFKIDEINEAIVDAGEIHEKNIQKKG